jgi:hypothetical protein
MLLNQSQSIDGRWALTQQKTPALLPGLMKAVYGLMPT